MKKYTTKLFQITRDTSQNSPLCQYLQN